MFRFKVCFVVGVCFFAAGVQAQPAPGGLPITRVVLYKNGIGYFEHLGRVRGSQDVTVSFTPGQLNDVLKSLTVLDLNGGRITGVAYGSEAPLERQLGELRLPAGEKVSLTEFLGALRGARLEVRSGNTTISGRLLSVERKTRISGGTTLEVDYLALIGDNGDVRTTELAPAFSVRLIERGLTGKVDRYLDLAGAAREPDSRSMVISAAGTGERALFVSYISEVPVWKSTYRIVLGGRAGVAPLLQGWAIVDNTVGQDWEKVRLSLVAGAPHSFVQNLSQPHYTRRPVVDLAGAVNLAPQTHESTLIPGHARLRGTVTDPMGAVIPGATVKAYDTSGALAAQTSCDARGAYELGSLPAGTIRLEVSASGFRTSTVSGIATTAGQTARRDVSLAVGEVANVVTVTAEPMPIQTSSSMMGSRSRTSGRRREANPDAPGVLLSPQAARTATEAAATAQELGDLFEYQLKEPISIRKNRSALVPIVNAPVGAEKVSLWNEQAGPPRPQRALWLTNSTGLTLDGGTFSVLEDETFAGEGILEALRPGEKRLVSYATDLALNVNVRHASESTPVFRARIAKGVLTHESEVREKKTYIFRNQDSAPRTVIVEHPVRADYQLRGDVHPVETTANWLRFRLPVPARATASLVVEEAKPMSVTYAIAGLSGEQIAVFASRKQVDREMEQALQRVIAQKAIIDGLEEQKDERDEERDRIFNDQQRLRENMEVISGNAEAKTLLHRYTRQLDEQENRIEQLRQEVKALEDKQQAARAELERMIQALRFDVKL